MQEHRQIDDERTVTAVYSDECYEEAVPPSERRENRRGNREPRELSTRALYKDDLEYEEIERKRKPFSTLRCLKIGMLLNQRYEILDVIGCGGFGIIYKAKDRELQRIVAIKEYFQQGVCNRIPGTKEVVLVSEEYRSRFQYGKERLIREARVLAQFQSPHIIRVNEFFYENNTSYVVMEYLPYDNLYRIKQTRDITIGICDALAEIHKANVIHRDIAPDNIILDDKGEVRIIDFGSARLDQEESRDLITAFKAGYAPPEQYRSLDSSKDSRGQGPWTDLYAVGATLYFMLTGIRPKESPARKLKVELDKKDPILSPAEIREDIPDRLSRIVMKAMAVLPSERYQKAEELKKVLQNDEDVAGIEEERRRRIRVRNAGIAAAFLFLAMVTGAGILWGIHKRQQAGIFEVAEISVWYPLDEAAENSRKEEAMEEILAQLSNSDQYRNITFDLHAIDQERYARELENSIQAGQTPGLFELPEGNLGAADGYADSLAEIVRIQESQKACWIKPKKNGPVLTTAVFVPVVYVNVALVEEAASIPDRITRIEDLLIIADIEQCSINMEIQEVLAEMLPDLETYRSAMKSGIDAFLDQECIVYIADTSDIDQVLADHAAQIRAIPIAADPILCRTADAWAMHAGSDAERKAEEAILEYLLSDYVQTKLYVENAVEGIPLNASAFEEYRDSRAWMNMVMQDTENIYVIQ